MDEIAHLPAGVHHWTTGRFDLYKVNPPLVRMAAALPAVTLGCATDWTGISPDVRNRSEFRVGHAFLGANGDASWPLFLMARLAVVPFSIIGLLVSYWLAAKMCGPLAGLSAAALWTFSPNLIAYGALILPDAPAAAAGLLAAAALWHYLEHPGWLRAIIAGAALGAALLTKTTLLCFLPLWLLIIMARGVVMCLTVPAGESEGCGVANLDRGRRRFSLRWRAFPTAMAHFGVITLLAIYLLNAGYGFEKTLVPLKHYQFTSRLLAGNTIETTVIGLPGNRFADTWLGDLRMPLPRSYLEGIDLQQRDFEYGCQTYLRGEWRNEGAWWYYLYAMLLKIPLGHLVLIAFSMGLLVVRPFRRERLSTWFLIAHAALIIGIVSSHTSCNRYMRYVLPAFPFLFVAAGAVLRDASIEIAALPSGESRETPSTQARNSGSVSVGPVHRPLIVATCLAASIVSVELYFPHAMSYFNELAGGPMGGHEHIIDANIDWGQDLYFLRQWQKENPQAKPFYLAYFGALDPAWMGIDFMLPPAVAPLESTAESATDSPEDDTSLPTRDLAPGWYAISVNILRGMEAVVQDGQGKPVKLSGPVFSRFLEMEPVGRAGYSIYVYHVP